MKFNYRKIASVLASAVMLSSTIGFAAAASYPAPFVVGGSADGAIIVGQSANPSDWYAAVDLGRDLSSKASASPSNPTATASGGDAKSLSSGSDLLYLGQKLSSNVDTITSSDLKTVLADGTFTDDDSNDYKYQQFIDMSNTTTTKMDFSKSSGSLDDPALILAMSTDPAKPVYTLRVSFSKAVPFNATASKTQPITIFGKQFTIGSGTDSDTLVLVGGSAETQINVGEKPTVTVGGTSYEVSLTGISSGSTTQDPEASISVNGETKTISADQTKKIGGIDVYVKDLFKTGDNAGYVIVQLGADKLTFQDGSEVEYGTDNKAIDGTLVHIIGGVGSMSELDVAVAAPSSDSDYILQGKSFTDPVFGTVQLQFVDQKNGPDLTKEVDNGVDAKSRVQLSIAKLGDSELGLSGLGTNTIPFQYQGVEESRDGYMVHVLEGDNISKNDIITLNGGKNNQYMLQLTTLDLRNSNSGSTISFKNVLTGATDFEKLDSDVKLNQTTGTSDTFILGGKTYTVTVANSSAISIISDTYGVTSGKKIQVYPYMDLVSGRDMRFAFTGGPLTIHGVNAGAVLSLPTGDLTVPSGNDTASLQALSKVGTVNYTITSTPKGASVRDITIYGPANDLKGVNGEGNASVMLVEEEDKTLSGSGLAIQNAVLLPTYYDGSRYSQANTPQFSSTSAVNQNFYDTGLSGYIDPFGVYALLNSKDDHQAVTSLTYPANGQQMYFDVFVAENGATVTPGGSGSGGLVSVYRDNEVDSVSDKNLLVIGGSCVNTVALKMIDSTATTPLCGADFTAKTKVDTNQYIIESMQSPYNTAKVAVLVAGFEAADTVNAIAKLKEGVTTDVGTSQVYPIIGTQ